MNPNANPVESNRLPLQGVRVVVTGASSGIGREIAIQLAAAGCQQLLIHYSRNSEGAEATSHLAREHGAETTVDACDFADAQATERFVKRAFIRWPRVDAWIHCAGADVLTGEAAEWSFDEKLRQLIDVDLLGSIRTGRLVAEQMREQEQTASGLPCSMIFIGWDQATKGMEGDAGQMFGPIKAGVQAFAMSLAQEYAPSVRVNVIAPGWIKTAWGESTSGYWHDRATGQALMNRWGSPADIALAAVYLTNPANQFVTAQTLVLNGGWNRRFERG